MLKCVHVIFYRVVFSMRMITIHIFSSFSHEKISIFIKNVVYIILRAFNAEF